jgi:ATP-dependent helicase HrpA
VSRGNGLDAIPAWQAATAHYERENLSSWSFGDLPAEIDLSGESGLPLKAFPALVLEGEQVHLRLLADASAALHATQTGWPALGTVVMGRDIAWLRNDLKDLKQIGALLLPLGDIDTVKASAWHHIQNHLFRTGEYLPLKESRFKKVLVRADEERCGIVPKLKEQLRALLEARQDICLLLEQKKTSTALVYPGMRAQMERIAPNNILEHYSFTELPHLTRFLKAMRLRAERAKDSLQRDIEKSKRLAPYEVRQTKLDQLAKSLEQHSQVKAYHMLLEEFKVSVYAQELGTSQKVSEKRLDKLADELERTLQ